ncbi:MAG: hypothetical protein J6C19_15720 [Lachnospiraceae bacterium]|nr:hypothetical protein [Lachnospiraceae bacterium]
MANISWTSSSLSSFFNTSLNTGSSPFSGLYSSLNDAAMIKSGSYKKLMRSYVNEVESGSSKDKSTSSSDSSKKRTKANAYTYDKDAQKSGSSIKNKVLDDLLDHTPYQSSIKNSVLDKLLSKNNKTDTVTTEDGTVVNKTEAADTNDTSAANTASNTTQVSEAAVGAVIDESV